jgi:hypothetical protein
MVTIRLEAAYISGVRQFQPAWDCGAAEKIRS